jgi:hypothetical protein
MSTTVTQTQEPIELTTLDGCHVRDGKDTLEEQPRVVPDDVPPPYAQGEAQRWNYPKGNMMKLGFSFLSFIIAGMNDAAVGVSKVHSFKDLTNSHRL